MMLNVGYDCKKCNLLVRDVQVRERADDEDVVNYVHYCNRMCCENHSIRSPYCNTKALDLMIPVTDKGVGKPGRRLTKEEIEEMGE